jgi:hypothetical protein
MTRLTLAFTAALALAFAAPALAGSQQDRMKDCNTKAADMKGDARKAFMKKCLSGASAAGNTQQQKMKSCNAEAKAKTLSGDERKKFMSECLSK